MKLPNNKRLLSTCYSSFAGMLFAFYLMAGASLLPQALHGRTDFSSFYTAGSLVRRHQGSDLYNLEIQRDVQNEVLNQSFSAQDFVYYIHPPFEALLFVPLVCFRYTTAYLMWASFNLGSVLLLPWVFIRENREMFSKHKWELLLTSLSFYPFFVTILQGQDSILFLWLLLASFLLLRKNHEFGFGVLLGLAFIKFHIAYILVIPLILNRRLKGLLGLVACWSVLALVSLGLVGTEGVKDYLRLLLELNDTYNRVYPWKMHNWSGQLYLSGFHGIQSLWGNALLGLLAVGLTGMLWYRKWDVRERTFGLRFAATLLLALLASPYLYTHDLSVAALVLGLCFEYALAQEGRGWKTTLLLILIVSSPVVWIWTVPIAVSDFSVSVIACWMSLLFVLIFTLCVLPGAKIQTLGRDEIAG